METNDPPLPPNYDSLADLQQRWLKQQQQQQENKSKIDKQHNQPQPIQQQIGETKKILNEKHETQKPNIQVKIGVKNVNKKKKHEKRRQKEQCETPKPNLQGKIGVKDVKKEQCEPHKQPNQPKIGVKDVTNSNPNVGKIGLKDVKEQEMGRLKEQCEPHKEREIGVKDVKSEKWEMRKLDSANSNTDLPNRRPLGRKYSDQKRRKEYYVVKTNPEPKPLKIEATIEAVEAKMDGGDQVDNNQVDGEEKATVERKINKKKKRKKQIQAAKERNQARNGECDGEEKGGKEVQLNPAVEIEQKFKEVSVGDRMVDIEEKFKEVSVGDRTVDIEQKFKEVSRDGRFWRRNEKSKAATNGECGEEKGGSEAPLKLKPVMGDRTVKTEEEVKKLSVEDDGRGWRSNERSRAVIEGTRGSYRGYGRGEHRGMRKPRREHGLSKWVKKGEVTDERKAGEF